MRGMLSLLAALLAALLLRRTTPLDNLSSGSEFEDGLSGSWGVVGAPSEDAFSVLIVSVDSFASLENIKYFNIFTLGAKIIKTKKILKIKLR